MTSAQPIKFETPDQGEETARADLYGLLSALFYSAPTQALLEAISSAPAQEDGVLGSAWRELCAACKGSSEQSVREEYEDLFISVGKPEIILYGSYYLSGFMMEKPLAELRSELARLGLERADSVVESEDHIASLCEVMRFLIASDDISQANMATQKAFYASHVQPWAMEMCRTLESHPRARFYAAVARLARSFFEVESQAFDMA